MDRGVLIALAQNLPIPPYLLPQETIALDKDFDTQEERLDAIIDDLNAGKITNSRIHELIYENYFNPETGVAKPFWVYGKNKINDVGGFFLNRHLTSFYRNTEVDLGEKDRTVVANVVDETDRYGFSDFASLDTDELVTNINEGRLPILALGDNGYESSLTWLAKQPSRENVIDDLLERLVDTNGKVNGHLAHFLAHSQLPDGKLQTKVTTIRDKEVVLADLVGLRWQSLSPIFEEFSSNRRTFLRRLSDSSHKHDLMLFYSRKFGFTYDKIMEQDHRNDRSDYYPSVLDYACLYNCIEAIRELLTHPSAREKLKTGWPLHYLIKDISTRDSDVKLKIALKFLKMPKFKEGMIALATR